MNQITVRMAHCSGAQADNCLIGQKGVTQLTEEQKPALLISYMYLKGFLEVQAKYAYRDWVLDSGAYSAYNSGAVINLQEYIDVCKRLLATDPTLVEVFALDVIGDWKASLANTEEMCRQGVPAIPCYHSGEPESVLKGLAKDYPKIALGGVALAHAKVKNKWAEQCFSRVWPKKIHGFAFCSETSVMSLPWHSVDATSWEIGPCKYGRWRSFGKMSLRGSKQDLRSEVMLFLDMERRARLKWAGAMKALDDQELNLRLAFQARTVGSMRHLGVV